MNILFKCLSSFIYIAFLLILFTFVYALFGMHIFGGKFPKDNDLYEIYNFDSFLLSFINVFNVMTLDNWNKILILSNDAKLNSAITKLYILSWMIFGNFILLNLFLAIILDSFTGNLNKSEDEDQKEYFIEEEELEEEKEEVNNLFQIPIKENKTNKVLSSFFSNLEFSKKNSKRGSFENTQKKNNMTDSGFLKIAEALKELEISSDRKTEFFENRSIKSPYKYKLHSSELQGCSSSLFIFDKNNFIRKLFFRIVNNKYFEPFYLFIVYFNSVQLIISTFIDYEKVTSIFFIYLCSS